MAIALPSSRSPVPSFGRFATFERATASYVDRPQAAMGSPHWPGQERRRGPAGDRPPTPFASPPAIRMVRTWTKSRVSIETRELRLSTRECDLQGLTSLLFAMKVAIEDTFFITWGSK